MIKKLLVKGYRFVRYPNRLRRLREYYTLHANRTRSSNMALNQLEMRQHAITLSSFPTKIWIDPLPACNLNCVFCPTATGWANFDRTPMTPETFHRIVERLPLDYVCSASLYTWGEPFLNKNVLDYVAYLKKRGIPTDFHSNLSLMDFDDAFSEKIVGSGLDELFASIDGGTEASYAQYRRGGDFHRALRNLKQITAAKKRLDSPTPRLHYKMLLNRLNEGEIDLARGLAEECGAELLIHENFNFLEEERDFWAAKSLEEKHQDIPITCVTGAGEMDIHTECQQMWTGFQISANGDVLPCCKICRREWCVGNILEQTFDEIWNGEKMKTLRRYVVDKGAPVPGFENLCVQCPNRYCTHKDLLKK